MWPKLAENNLFGRKTFWTKQGLAIAKICSDWKKCLLERRQRVTGHLSTQIWHSTSRLSLRSDTRSRLRLGSNILPLSHSLSTQRARKTKTGRPEAFSEGSKTSGHAEPPFQATSGRSRCRKCGQNKCLQAGGFPFIRDIYSRLTPRGSVSAQDMNLSPQQSALSASCTPALILRQKLAHSRCFDATASQRSVGRANAAPGKGKLGKKVSMQWDWDLSSVGFLQERPISWQRAD